MITKSSCKLLKGCCLQIDNGTYSEIAAIYDTKTNTYEPFHIPEAPFCGAQACPLLMPPMLPIGFQSFSCVVRAVDAFTSRSALL